jgi:hypothetical protein
VVDQLERSNFSSSLLNSLANLGVFLYQHHDVHLTDKQVITKSIFHIHSCSSAFQDAERSDHSRRHSILRLIDLEVFQRPDIPPPDEPS